MGCSSSSGESGERSRPNIGGSDYWLLRIDESGQVLEDHAFGGDADERLMHVLPTADGGLILAGDSRSGVTGNKTAESKGGADFWVLGLDATRTIRWQYAYGGDQTEELTEAIATQDGGYLLGGYSESSRSGYKTDSIRGNRDFWLVKLNEAGILRWERTLGGEQNDYLDALLQLPNGTYLVGGASSSGVSGDKTENSRGNDDYWLLKLSSEPTATPQPQARAGAALRLLGNPVQGRTVRMQVDADDLSASGSWHLHDVLGRHLAQGQIDLRQPEMHLHLPEGLAAGTYFLTLHVEQLPPTTVRLVVGE